VAQPATFSDSSSGTQACSMSVCSPVNQCAGLKPYFASTA
jgi:hypothetical protein